MPSKACVAAIVAGFLVFCGSVSASEKRLTVADWWRADPPHSTTAEAAELRAYVSGAWQYGVSAAAFVDEVSDAVTRLCFDGNQRAIALSPDFATGRVRLYLFEVGLFLNEMQKEMYGQIDLVIVVRYALKESYSCG